VDAESDTGEADRQDHEHRQRDRDALPRSVQDRQEDEQQHRVPDYRGLGMATGKAQTGLMGDRVGQDRA